MRNSQPRTKSELQAALIERELRLLKAEQARRSFAAFVSYMMPEYVHTPFSLAVCEAVDQFVLDVQAGKRPILILQAPPQHGKSELISRHLPAYLFGLFPHWRVGACSYNADLASGMNRDVQRIMMSDEYKAVFPHSHLNPKRVVTVEGQALRNSERFDVINQSGKPGIAGSRDGYYVCAGVGGPLTGKSLDVGVIDDPIKNAEEAASPAVKASILAWYNTVFLTRMSKDSGHIIMATSWAVDDLAATVLKKNKRAKHLKFPAINEKGEALVPHLHPIEQLREIEEALAGGQWSALYQQNPVKEGGNVFAEKWFRRWNATNLPPSFDEMIASWDMTFKDKKDSDYVAGQIWGRSGVHLYLLDQVCERMSFTASVKAVLTLLGRFPGCTAVLVEDKANGPAVMDVLKSSVVGLVPIEPDGSKFARAAAVTSWWAAGNVYIPEQDALPWVKGFETELTSFPAGDNDDQVDAMTQALRYLVRHGLYIWEKLADG